MSKFAKLVKAELQRARQHPQFNSAHEAYGVLKEEVDEFWDEVKKKSKNRDPANMLLELVQIAAVAQKAAESLKLMPVESGDFPG